MQPLTDIGQRIRRLHLAGRLHLSHPQARCPDNNGNDPDGGREDGISKGPADQQDSVQVPAPSPAACHEVERATSTGMRGSLNLVQIAIVERRPIHLRVRHAIRGRRRVLPIEKWRQTR